MGPPGAYFISGDLKWYNLKLKLENYITSLIVFLVRFLGSEVLHVEFKTFCEWIHAMPH